MMTSPVFAEVVLPLGTTTAAADPHVCSNPRAFLYQSLIVLAVMFMAAAIGNEQGLFEKIDTDIVTNIDNLYDFAKNPDGYSPVYSVAKCGFYCRTLPPNHPGRGFRWQCN
ncbi:MAG TPA: hypothetical protein GX498_02770 [Clostridiales bacterium]|nr:hypothetical protein [Clostridiales bacterium]